MQSQTINDLLVEVGVTGDALRLVLSEMTALNGVRMPLLEAAGELLGQEMASLLVIDPEHLALYLAERHDESLLLRA